jgi:hypothetical protein
MGAYCLLYASVSEYVLLFGTVTGSTGHSGRYWADIEDTLLQGHFRQWLDGSVRGIDWRPGQTIPHPKWTATGMAWAPDTWMVEYARGVIPSTLPFALGDSMLSAQDWWSVARSLRIYGLQVLGNALAGRL